MSDLSVLASPAFASGAEEVDEASAGLDRLERAVAATLAGLKPGRRGDVASVHREMQRLVLTNAVLLEVASKLPPSKVAGFVQRLHPSKVIDQALEKTAKAHAEALAQAGLPASVPELLQSWVEVTVDARVVQRQIELKRAIDSLQTRPLPGEPKQAELPEPDPGAPLSAVALGQALGGLSDETVRQRERAGELFSILRSGRKRGREYPAFQAWPGIAGQPLARVMHALGSRPGAVVGSTVAYGFFTSPTDLLAGLTPIEALAGRLTSRRRIDPDAEGLLAAPADERLQAVVHAAEAQAAQLTA